MAVNVNNGHKREIKKTGNKQTYVTTQRLVYTKSVRELYKKFMELNSIDCSHSLFCNYKPFYVIPPTGRDQQSCLCIRCQNSHLLLKDINLYQKEKKLSQNTSVTAFLYDSQSLKPSDRTDISPEFNDEKEINYYIFGPKTKSYLKNRKEIQYTRTAHIDK